MEPTLADGIPFPRRLRAASSDALKLARALVQLVVCEGELLAHGEADDLWRGASMGVLRSLLRWSTSAPSSSLNI